MRFTVTAAITLILACLLGFQHFSGGVPAHHLLARTDLPVVSNWWGLLTLPALSWFLLGRIERRLANEPANKVLLGAGAALLFGVILALFFVFGPGQVPGYMAQSLLLIAVFYPIYRAECVLGFVLGMTFTFGAVLPTIFAAIFAAVSALIFHGLRFIWARIGALRGRAG